ncbi:conserved hypothetical protein [Methanococcus maripaludis C5]|uniref:Uncharacterized protein n=1 Tax=Methanococcus maripaludis (strain C5 / ATCC BAA-1333) TaxID=402880 RepID=A4FWW3_METM5|nr:hypothetical protein [Methanococcus maripaludis]ABO34692.1 conserved hypothetical protein [Methanococcus maripaludis C5]
MIDEKIRSELEYYIRYELRGVYKSRMKGDIYEIEFENTSYLKYFKKLLEKEGIKTKDADISKIEIFRDQYIGGIIDLLKKERMEELIESMNFHNSVIEFISRNFNPIITSGRESGIIRFKMMDDGEAFAYNELKELGFNVSLENESIIVDISDTVKEMFKRVSTVFDLENMTPYYAFSVTEDEAIEKCKKLDELSVPYKYSDVHREIYLDFDSLKHVISKFKND